MTSHCLQSGKTSRLAVDPSSSVAYVVHSLHGVVAVELVFAVHCSR